MVLRLEAAQGGRMSRARVDGLAPSTHRDGSVHQSADFQCMGLGQRAPKHCKGWPWMGSGCRLQVRARCTSCVAGVTAGQSPHL